MIIELIKNKIIKDREDRPFEYRASTAGSCIRSLCYQKLGIKGEPIGDRGLLTFKHGELVEQTLLSYAVGIYDNQREVSITDGDITISGHIDGLFDWVHENGKETIVIDFKSINTRGFSKAQKGIVDYKYIVQMNLYMHALGLNKALLIYFNKDTSHLHEQIVYYDVNIVKHTIDKIHKVKECTKDSIPIGEYHIDSKDNGWICSYCSYTSLCYPDRKVVIEKGKPKYVENKQEELKPWNWQLKKSLGTTRTRTDYH